MDAKERISHLLERWFISEPALFSVICMHKIEENGQMACPIRTGKCMVEYNAKYVEEMTDHGLEEALKTEAIRILMNRPMKAE